MIAIWRLFRFALFLLRVMFLVVSFILSLNFADLRRIKTISR
jgi:hypothetical protein